MPRPPRNRRWPGSAHVRCTGRGKHDPVPFRPDVHAFLVLSGSQVGRWVGIAAGAIGCISAIWWMPYYPIWSLTYIAIGVLVIYALAAYGGKAEAA